MKILLVDDSRTIRNIQKNVLGQLGYTDVVEAGDGIEALRVLRQASVNLMLVNWNMPNMDGLSLVKAVRQSNSTLPIIMCTTEAQRSRVLEAVKAGVNNYVVKPFTAETMAEKIEHTLATGAGKTA